MQLVVCLNESNAAQRAIELAHSHARAFDAEIHLITALMQRGDVKERDADSMQRADEHLEQAKQDIMAKGFKCSAKLLVSEMSIGESILRYAEENGIDEIIIGIEKTSKVGKAVFGSTAQFVILGSPCPVVCIR